MVDVDKIKSVHDLKLVHYSAEEIRELDKSVEHYNRTFDMGPYAKPLGLWVSVDTFDDNWRTWCINIGNKWFNEDEVRFPHEVRLRADANVLWLRSAGELDKFSHRYKGELPPVFEDLDWISIDWKRVEQDYQGIIIAPYIWSRRLYPTSTWYYGWDCASGCIWDLSAIDEFRCQATIGEPEQNTMSGREMPPELNPVEAPFFVCCDDSKTVFVKEGNFFRDEGGLTSEWGKHWRPILAGSIGDARRKGAELFGVKLSWLYLGEE